MKHIMLRAIFQIF